ncbi:MAG: hypothetical protein M3Y87_10950 [Myxococcota bacterium]|nr:hypothetical protein [Myxococcota bacterium]
MATDRARAVREIFDDGEVREVLRDTFYRSEAPLMPLAATAAPIEGKKKRRRAAKPKPDHYEIICISLYNEDLARLDAKVADLKGRGHRRMTRSALIRWALDQLDLDTVPRGI